MLESAYQRDLIKRIKDRFPGCMVLKNDPNYIQGIPDLVIVHEDRWVALEVKRSEKASHRPNQEYYIQKMDEMSLARFIYPENEEEVLDEVQRSFETCR